MLDGTVQPMLAPELNLEDTHLSRALDELARLVDAPIQSPTDSMAVKSESDDGENENQIPRPLPEPIPIEVPLPPTPIIVQPPINASLNLPFENGAVGERSLLAELASLSNAPSINESFNIPAEVIRPKVRTNRSDYSMWAIALLMFIAFMTGMLTERFFRTIENFRRSEGSSNLKPKASESELGLTGRITYKNKAGESQPDSGARILLFPQQRNGDFMLSTIGFRPADNSIDQLAANAAIKSLGGAATTADENGAFRIPIEAGSYRVLVLSHFQPNDSTDRDAALDKLLSEYFDKPETLLGRVKHQLSPVRIKGSGDIWDHSF